MPAPGCRFGCRAVPASRWRCATGYCRTGGWRLGRTPPETTLWAALSEGHWSRGALPCARRPWSRQFPPDPEKSLRLLLIGALNLLKFLNWGTAGDRKLRLRTACPECCCSHQKIPATYRESRLKSE